jgi:hypothetical protein
MVNAGFGQLAEPLDHHLQLGRIRIAPEGFFDAIGEWRSATTPDTVWTQFGRIPLTPSDSQSLLSLAHSRGMVHIDAPLGPVISTTYLEQDFMRSSEGVPFRWRQYWTRAKIGNWEVLGGQMWSLLRPNRVGIEPDRALMNTDALEPNYQVGLVGQRRRQVRLGYSSETWKIALAWEGATGLWVGKYAKDSKNAHLEIAGFTGRGGVNGVSLAQVIRVAPKLRIIGQQFASKGALAEALGIVPYGVSGISGLIGAEVPATANLNLFTYYGFVYGGRSNTNRLTAQYSLGFHQQLWRRPDTLSSVVLSAQYSHVDRAIWSGSAGSMDYVQTSIRYTFK